MGIIIREFACGDCGCKFESSDPVEEVVCPTCSSEEAEREFRTAPALKSPKTARADQELKNLAADFGMTNISNKDGGPVKRGPAAGPASPQFAEGNPQVMHSLARLGANADGFSGVLPALRASGRPHQWQKTPERRK